MNSGNANKADIRLILWSLAALGGLFAAARVGFYVVAVVLALRALFIGFDVVGRANTRLAVRLIGGTWGRRIMPWVKSGDVVSRSVRIGMMRPATRVDLYLPSQVKLLVNVGDEVAGGQSVVAKFE